MNLTVSYLDKLRLPLLHKLYKDNYPSGKPKGKEDIVILEEGKKIIGSIRIKTYEDCHFLTGMMIINEKRQQKYGSKLLECISQFLSLNVIYCLCDPQLSSFYIKNKFEYALDKETPYIIKSKHARYTKDGKSLDILVYKKLTI